MYNTRRRKGNQKKNIQADNLQVRDGKEEKEEELSYNEYKK